MRAFDVRSRTSDRVEASRLGARALGERLGAEPIGSFVGPRTQGWEADLHDAGPVLDELATATRQALADGERPLALAGDCTLCLATLPVVWAAHPDATLLWLDAHPDLHTPASTPSGFLGGMCLAASVGRWDAGTGTGPRLEQVRFVDVRDAEEAERDAMAGAGLSWPADLADLTGEVFVHVDCDVLDPAVLPATFPAPGGLSLAQLRALLADVADRCDVIGAEVTSADVSVVDGLEEALAPLFTALQHPLRAH